MTRGRHGPDPPAQSRALYGSVSVTCFGMQLSSSATPSAQERPNSLYRIDRNEARMTEQTEAGDTEDRVKDVDHIARTIRHAAMVRILPTTVSSDTVKSTDTHLAFEDEGAELLPVDPVQPLDHGQTAQHPPTVADVL